VNKYRVIKTIQYTEELIVEAETAEEAEQYGLTHYDEGDVERMYDDTLMAIQAVWIPDWEQKSACAYCGKLVADDEVEKPADYCHH